MKSIVKYIIAGFVLCIGIGSPALADDCGDLPPCHYEDDVPGITCCEVIEAPFDGGLTLMLAAGGIGMGVKAMRRKKNK